MSLFSSSYRRFMILKLSINLLKLLDLFHIDIKFLSFIIVRYEYNTIQYS